MLTRRKRKRLRHYHHHPSLLLAVPFEKVRENIISQITDLMCSVDWQDHELRNVWTALENLRSLLPAAEKGAAGA